MPKHRTQLLLEEDQFQILTKIAELEGRSISDIARRLIGAGLSVLQDDYNGAIRQTKIIREGRAVYNAGNAAGGKKQP
jgi:hypothetical protein